MVRFPFLNIEIHNWYFDDFVKNLQDGVVVTPNVDHLIKLQHDFEFYQCYQQADHVICDSRILMLLSKLLDSENPIKAQIAGSDLLPAFCRYNRDHLDKFRVFLLGGTELSVVRAMDNINRNCNSKIVVGAYSPPFGFEADKYENEKIINIISESGATVLAVGVGAPKQEKWIFKNRSNLPFIKLFMAVGATIDFEAGRISRAPKWMSNIGLEWVYRMFQEPRRMIRRYIFEDLPIFKLVFQQRLGRYKNPWGM